MKQLFSELFFWAGKFYLSLCEFSGFVQRMSLGFAIEKLVWSGRRVVEYTMRVPRSFTPENARKTLEGVLREASIQFVRFGEYGIELVDGHPDDGSIFPPEVRFEQDGSLTFHVPFGSGGIPHEGYWDNFVQKLSEKYWGSW